MTERLKQRAGLAMTLAIALCIAVLGFIPMPATGPVMANDKLIHFLGFAILVLPVAAVHPRHVPWIFIAAVTYGGAIELLQPFTGRTRSWGDLVADGAGAALGCALGRVVFARLVGRGRFN